MSFSVVTVARGRWNFGELFCQFHVFGRVFTFGLASLYTMGVIAISRYFRVAKGLSLTRDGTQIIIVMRDLAQISRVRREWA